MSQLTIQILGWLGTAIIVVAYYLVSVKKLSGTSRTFQVMNLLGAITLGINVYCNKVWPALTLEVIWGLIAIVALVRNR